jgi:3-oxoacyl-[acyl-carrier protein] reductase
MKIDLTGKVALVTGAGRGIGKAVAVAFAQAGADVACVSRTEANAQQIATEIQGLGRKSQAYAVDVSQANAVSEACDKIVKDFGKVDFLINNAGVTRDGLLMRMSEEDWNTVINTNLSAAFFFTKALSRSMLKQRAGKIINITSIIGLIGNAGQANYAASKAGLIGLTKSVAREFASRGITCNAIAPGFIETDMTKELNDEVRKKLLENVPLARLGKPEDVAVVALFLASPAADYITGQVLTVDGGMVMS